MYGRQNIWRVSNNKLSDIHVQYLYAVSAYKVFLETVPGTCAVRKKSIDPFCINKCKAVQNGGNMDAVLSDIEKTGTPTLSEWLKEVNLIYFYVKLSGLSKLFYLK